MAIKSAKNSIQAFSIFGRYIVTVAVGALLVHCAITVLNIYIFQKPSGAGFANDFILHLFSYKMIPTVATHGIFLSIAYYFYYKTKKIMRILNQHEIKKEKTKTMIKTSQNTTGTIIDHISVYNSEIMQWLNQKKQDGEVPPKKIVDASRKIGKALITLSRKSFLYPYLDAENLNYDNLMAASGENLTDDLSIK